MYDARGIEKSVILVVVALAFPSNLEEVYGSS